MRWTMFILYTLSAVWVSLIEIKSLYTIKLLTKDRTVHAIATAQTALQVKALALTICLLQLSPEH